jgi:hypothetical protein
MTMSTSFNRRTMLRAAGAAAFVTPFTKAFTRNALGAPPPKRLITFWHANGAPAVGEWASLLKPLETAKLLQVKGIDFPNGDHKEGMPFSTTGYRQEPKPKAAGPSLDTLVAKATGKPPLLLTGRGKPQNMRGWISFDEGGNPVLPIESPRDAFTSVFGKDPGGPGLVANPGPMHADLETAILNAATADANDLLARLPMSAKDAKDKLAKAAAAQRGKINDFLGATKSVELLLAASERQPGAAGACNVTDEQMNRFREPEAYWLVEDRLKLHIELIVAAFACNLTQVASLMVTPGGHDEMDFGYLGIKSEADKSSKDLHNGIAHFVTEDNDKGGTKIPTMAERVTAERSRRLMRIVKTWDMQFLAMLIDRLRSTPEPGGTGSLLDNTLILSTSEMGNSNHYREQVPVFLAGGLLPGSDGVATLAAGSTSYQRLLLTCAHRVGAALPAFAGVTQPLADSDFKRS